MKTYAANYLDYAAGAPPWPEAMDVFKEAAEEFIGNPSSNHSFGQRSGSALAANRARLQELCGFSGGRVVLTSGGTEANNLVIRGIMDQHPKGRLLLAGDVHPSVWFAKEPYAKRVDVVSPDSNGLLTPENLSNHITKRTVLCSIVHVNNETGVLQDVRALAKVCADKRVLLHCDGAQALGHCAVELDSLNVDFYTFAGHKFGGPRGVGGVFLRDTLPLPQLEGGGQEKGLRAGTENVSGMAATVKALECSLAILSSEDERLRALANKFVDEVRALSPEVVLNSDLQTGRPGLVSLSFTGTEGGQLVAELGLHGFALSAGSACHSGEVKASRIILAMGRSPAEALGTVRISMGRTTEPEEIKKFTTALIDVVERQRALA
jgi:cysteine desulfurase